MLFWIERWPLEFSDIGLILLAFAVGAVLVYPGDAWRLFLAGVAEIRTVIADVRALDRFVTQTLLSTLRSSYRPSQRPPDPSPPSEEPDDADGPDTGDSDQTP